jgi:hypothetical protein
MQLLEPFEEIAFFHLSYWVGLWRLTPLSTIFQLYRGGKLLGKLPFVEKCAV